MNLNPNSIYKITKIKTMRENRHIKDGDTVVGQAALNELGRLIVGDLITSLIVNTTEIDRGYIVETQNSVYTLVEEK